MQLSMQAMISLRKMALLSLIAQFFQEMLQKTQQNFLKQIILVILLSCHNQDNFILKLEQWLLDVFSTLDQYSVLKNQKLVVI